MQLGAGIHNLQHGLEKALSLTGLSCFIANISIQQRYYSHATEVVFSDYSWSTQLNHLTLAIEAARATPSADNSQPWRLYWDGDNLSIHYRQHYDNDPFGSSGHATLLSIGALSENLTQALPGCEHNPSLIDLKEGEPYFSIPVSNTAVLADSRKLALFQRHTNRFPFIRQPLDLSLIEELDQLVEPLVRLRPIHTAQERNNFSALTQMCCEARFCNQELHQWLMRSLRFSQSDAKQGYGLDLATLSLPPGGKWFMKWIRPWSRMNLLNRIGAYRLMAHTEASLLRQAPLILTIVGTNSSQGNFAAGRLMERTWIRLNQLGWAVHPYYVVADQETRLLNSCLPPKWENPIKSAINQAHTLLNLPPNERIHIVFRVGRPTRIPTRSQRLPLNLIFEDKTVTTTHQFQQQ